MNTGSLGAAPPDKLEFKSLQQAAQWYAQLRADNVSDDDRRRWRDWMNRHPQHRAAWLHIENVSRRFEPLNVSAERDANVAALEAATSARMGRRRVLAGLAAASLTGLLGWELGGRNTLLPLMSAWAASHRTATGEIRAVTLADGTQLWLNTASAVDVDYSATLRRLRMHAGEILIETAHEALRPFVVETGEGRMQALGTRFNIRLENGSTQLAVYEGAVEVRTAENHLAQRIDAGAQIRFTNTQIGNPTPLLSDTASWSRGVLRADDISLADFLHELGRYRRGHLACAPEIADLRVIGTFPLRDTDRALAMLEHALPIHVRRILPWWTSIEASIPVG